MNAEGRAVLRTCSHYVSPGAGGTPVMGAPGHVSCSTTGEHTVLTNAEWTETYETYRLIL